MYRDCVSYVVFKKAGDHKVPIPEKSSNPVEKLDN